MIAAWRLALRIASGKCTATAAVAINVVHGICYAFFFATVYIFVDAAFPKDVPNGHRLINRSDRDVSVPVELRLAEDLATFAPGPDHEQIARGARVARAVLQSA